MIDCGFFGFLPESPAGLPSVRSTTSDEAETRDLNNINSQGASALPARIAYSEATGISVASGGRNLTALVANAEKSNPSCFEKGYAAPSDDTQVFANAFCRTYAGTQVPKVVFDLLCISF